MGSAASSKSKYAPLSADVADAAGAATAAPTDRKSAATSRTSKGATAGDAARTAGDAARPAVVFDAASKVRQHPAGVKISDFYDFKGKKELGAGTYGSVCTAKRKTDLIVRAIKTISKTNPGQDSKGVTEKEVNCMKALDHPNIVRLEEVFEDYKKFYLVMEVAGGGELFDVICEQQRLTESTAAVLMQQMFRALNYMHDHKLCHRDLKPENFLLAHKVKDPAEGLLKLVDFGLATHFEVGKKMTTKAGTPYYVAPQVLAGSYTHACDMWSLGVIMYVMLCGYPPFWGDTDQQVLAKVRRCQYTFSDDEWKTASPDSKALIKTLLLKDEQLRATAAKALGHAWLTTMMEKRPGPSQAEDVDDDVAQRIMDNMRRFSSQNRFKKAALQMIATQMTDGSVNRLREMFIAMDKNGDGTLECSEIAEVLKGFTESDIDVNKFSLEGKSGLVSYTEFLSASMDKRMAERDDALWAAFKAFDLDGNGVISKAEMQEVLSGDALGVYVSKETVDEIMQEVDKDGNGTIDFEEFKVMMKT